MSEAPEASKPQTIIAIVTIKVLKTDFFCMETSFLGQQESQGRS
jgi:hypothetical protein